MQEIFLNGLMPSDKNLSFEQIVKELDFLKASLSSYSGKEYKQAVLKIKYLRNKQIQIRKKPNGRPGGNTEIE